MKHTLTLTALLALNPCNPDSRAKFFNGSKPQTVKGAFAAGATVDEILWIVGQLDCKAQIVTFAQECAKRAKGYAAADAAARHADAAARHAAAAARYAAAAARYAAAVAADAAAAAAAAARHAAAAAAAETKAQIAHLITLFSE